MRRVSSIASLSFCLPIFERCERPVGADSYTAGDQPGRFLHGPLLKSGHAGRTDGIVDSARAKRGESAWRSIGRHSAIIGAARGAI